MVLLLNRDPPDYTNDTYGDVASSKFSKLAFESKVLFTIDRSVAEAPFRSLIFVKELRLI